jgi:hypothetical protein
MSHHNQLHQHQPKNPSNAAQHPQPLSTPTSLAEPSSEDIRTRAYEISQSRHGGAGNAADDWSQAERELIAAAAKMA